MSLDIDDTLSGAQMMTVFCCCYNIDCTEVKSLPTIGYV